MTDNKKIYEGKSLEELKKIKSDLGIKDMMYVNLPDGISKAEIPEFLRMRRRALNFLKKRGATDSKEGVQWLSKQKNIATFRQVYRKKKRETILNNNPKLLEAYYQINNTPARLRNNPGEYRVRSRNVTPLDKYKHFKTLLPLEKTAKFVYK